MKYFEAVGVVVLLLFLVCAFAVKHNSYDVGFYDGLKVFCPLGDINVYGEGDIRCDMPLNASESVLEVNLYGFKT